MEIIKRELTNKIMTLLALVHLYSDNEQNIMFEFIILILFLMNAYLKFS